MFPLLAEANFDHKVSKDQSTKWSRLRVSLVDGDSSKLGSNLVVDLALGEHVVDDSTD